jgi:PAS domain S-box-containing protein
VPNAALIAVALVATALVAAGVVALRRRRRSGPGDAPPGTDVARRLQLALDAGRMGTWSWDMRDNRVEWDDSLALLFGMEPGIPEMTFEGWASSLHPEDRARALATVEEAVRTGGQFRFDHRTIWPDGSVHWIEGRGETVADASGTVIGAIGIAIDIDDRRRGDLERLDLLASEQRARAGAERSMAALTRLQEVTLGLSGATTVDDIARLILERGMTALGAVSGYFATLDQEKRTLVMRAQIGYADQLIDNYRFVDIEAPLPAPEVLRSGTPMFVESREDGERRYPHFPRDPRHGAFVVHPLFVNGEPSAAVALGFDEPRQFDSEERAFIHAVVEGCAQALQRALLFEAEQTGRDRLRTLLEASERLAALDDPDRQLVVAAEIASHRIGRWATIQIVEPDGTIRRAALEHADPQRVPLLRELVDNNDEGLAVTRHVVETREPFIVHEPPPNPETRKVIEELNVRSVIAVPMTVGSRCIGVLSVGDDRPLRLGATELELAMDLGRRTASAYERARLLQAARERTAVALRESEERLAAEHRIVELLQRTILPEDLPRVRGVELTARYQPAEIGVEVGGDWYDAFSDERGGIVIVIGDVAGHGVGAAALMGRVRNAARAFAVEDPNPARILTRLDHLLRTLETDAFATAIAAHFDPATRTLLWARAGHPPPLLCTAARHEYLEAVGGTPLGVMVNTYTCESRQLEPGSLLVLYTDGLVERRARSIDDGMAWLAARVGEKRGADLEALCASLIDERFGNAPSEDDVCVFALRTTA